jgi:hypothetical protein
MSPFTKKVVARQFTKKVLARFLAEISQVSSGTKSSAYAALLQRKERQLRVTLRNARKEYIAAIQLDRCRNNQRQMLSSVHRDSKKLKAHLAATQRCWSKIGKYGGKEEIARFAPGSDSREELDSFIRRFEETVRLMIQSAEGCRSEKQFTWRGRPRRGKSGISLFALTEFAKIIQAFWIQEIPPAFSFGYNGAHSKKARKQLNAATLVMLRSAQWLDTRCTLSNVRQAMEAARREPMLYGTIE